MVKNTSGTGFCYPAPVPITVLHTRVCYAPLGSNSNFYDCVVVSSNKCNVIVSIYSFDLITPVS